MNPNTVLKSAVESKENPICPGSAKSMYLRVLPEVSACCTVIGGFCIPDMRRLARSTMPFTSDLTAAAFCGLAEEVITITVYLGVAVDSFLYLRFRLICLV